MLSGWVVNTHPMLTQPEAAITGSTPYHNNLYCMSFPQCLFLPSCLYTVLSGITKKRTRRRDAMSTFAVTLFSWKPITASINFSSICLRTNVWVTVHIILCSVVFSRALLHHDWFLWQFVTVHCDKVVLTVSDTHKNQDTLSRGMWLFSATLTSGPSFLLQSKDTVAVTKGFFFLFFLHRMHFDNWNESSSSAATWSNLNCTSSTCLTVCAPSLVKQ